MNADKGATNSYVQDSAYNSNFTRTQAPILLSYVAATAGYAPPDPAGPFRYVELGCGGGATLNGLAAAYPHGKFVGVDFNAQSIAMARQTAAEAGLGNVQYIEAAFSALDGAALGQADYIASVGTYSWLDDVEKSAFIRVIAASLKTGGLLNLGYITLGRAAVTPMWQILRALAPAGGQSSQERVKAGIRILGKLRDHGAKYLQQNPQSLALLEDVTRESEAGDARAIANLSHNLLAEDYRAELLDKVSAGLAGPGLEFIGCAAPHSNDPQLCVPVGLRDSYEALPGRMAQELFKDFLDATVVRSDIFVRNARPDTAASHRYLIDRSRVTLVGDREETWRQLERPGWTSFNLATPATRYVFDRIAADGIGGIAALVQGAPYGAEDVCDAYFKLAASPGFELCFDAQGAGSAPLPARVRPASGYNHLALAAARNGAEAVNVAVPGLGNCVPVALPAALLLAELCASGTAVVTETLQKSLAAQPGALPGVQASLARQIVGQTLPMLLRFGALEAA